MSVIMHNENIKFDEDSQMNEEVSACNYKPHWSLGV